MDKKELLSMIGNLESKVDLLETEFSHINDILKQCGFPEGIKTLKEAVNEILEENPSIKKKQNS